MRIIFTHIKGGFWVVDTDNQVPVARIRKGDKRGEIHVIPFAVWLSLPILQALTEGCRQIAYDDLGYGGEKTDTGFILPIKEQDEPVVPHKMAPGYGVGFD